MIGVARTPMSTEDFRKKVSEDIKQFATGEVDPDLWEWFARRMLLRQRRLQWTTPISTPNSKNLLDQGGQRPFHPRQLFLLPGHRRRISSAPSSKHLAAVGLMEEERAALAARDHRKTLRARSRIGPGAEQATAEGRWTKSRSTASITTWAKKRSRTFWRFASPTESSSPSGTAATSITSRSPWPKPSASNSAAATTTRPAPCATWCPTTSCSSSASPRWSRRFRFGPTRCATSRPRFCTPSSP